MLDSIYHMTLRLHEMGVCVFGVFTALLDLHLHIPQGRNPLMSPQIGRDHAYGWLHSQNHTNNIGKYGGKSFTFLFTISAGIRLLLSCQNTVTLTTPRAFSLQ